MSGFGMGGRRPQLVMRRRIGYPRWRSLMAGATKRSAVAPAARTGHEAADIALLADALLLFRDSASPTRQRAPIRRW